MVSARGRRQQVTLAKRRGLSERRACALLDVARSSLGYQSKLDGKDEPILKHMRELAAQYPRYGYRRIRIFLRRRGLVLSRERTYRLWRKAKLQLPKKRPRKRIATGRPRPKAPTRMNEVWAYDFVFDACADGRQIKCLTVVDEWTRESLAIDVAGSIRSGRVIEVLSKLISTRGAPRYLRSDNGPEFVSRAVLSWLDKAGIDTAPIDPGKPWQNGTNESFNDKFRDECLSLEWFRNRAEAKAVIEAWRIDYNEVRPHSSLRRLDTERVSKEVPVRNETCRGKFQGTNGPLNPGRPDTRPMVGRKGRVTGDPAILKVLEVETSDEGGWTRALVQREGDEASYWIAKSDLDGEGRAFRPHVKAGKGRPKGPKSSFRPVAKPRPGWVRHGGSLATVTKYGQAEPRDDLQHGQGVWR